MLISQYGVLPTDGGTVEYIRFGRGKTALIMLPGLGDSLIGLRGKSAFLALFYRSLWKDFTVYMISRQRPMPQGYTTRQMAADIRAVMDGLNIPKAHLLGVSMGGMIAQHLAADFPERVEKLVLTVTCHRNNAVMRQALGEWIALAEKGDHRGLMESNLRLIYSDRYYRQNRWAVPLVGRLTRPASYENFFIQAAACLSHDGQDQLPRIKAPTLIIAGAKDRVIDPQMAQEMAERIEAAQLLVYPDGRHGLYEEEKTFLPQVRAFLQQ